MKLELENYELLLTFENVQLIDRSTSKPKATGDLHLLSSHLVFIDSDTKRHIWIYYSLVASVDRLPLNTLGFPLLIKCKHFLTCLFSISKERDCQSICATVLRFSRPPKVQELLCFQENKQLVYLKPIKLNHSMFNLESEYARMGVPNNEWALTDLNYSYELCSTYPTHLYVPSRASKAVLQASASFRSRGRLPVLSYLHSNGASICRCAQPLTGLNARSNEDEQLMQFILATNPNAGVLYVVDTRPKINAMANKAQGKGYENENNYANTQFYFIGIENIHVMRDSLQKLTQCTEANSSGTNQFLYSLEKCDWLKHIKAVIDTSIFIAEAVGTQNISVVVHCSDGWDRTSQVCALAALLLDPYYRTIHGFQVLIERDWLMFGHKFTHRLGHVFENESVSKEISPVFAQFLECIWQISQQFPCAFEFNERFLIKLYEHCYSCQFGTFVGNCQKEREELKLKDISYSYWDYVQYKLNDFINPLYVPNSVYSREILKPDTRPQNFNFWTGLYNRFEANVNVNEKMYDILNIIKNKTTSLNDYAKQLEKRYTQLKVLLGNSSEDQKSENSESDAKSIQSADNLSLMVESLSTMDSTESTEQQSKNAKINIDELTNDLNAISLLTWKSLRRSCWCYDANDYASSKSNCSKCGNLFCDICMEDGEYADNTKKFICKKCKA